MDSTQSTNGTVYDVDPQRKSRSWLIWVVIILLLGFLGVSQKFIQDLNVQKNDLTVQKTALKNEVTDYRDFKLPAVTSPASRMFNPSQGLDSFRPAGPGEALPVREDS